MLIIEKDLCKGCHICVEFCPRGVLKISDKLNRIGYFYATVKDKEKCNKCGLCENYCPDFAISVEEND